MPRRCKPPALVGGPYQKPPCEVGSSLVCRIRGQSTVAGISAAPVPWPWARRAIGGGTPILIVCGDLERAIRCESRAAIVHHWGVDPKVVSRWRAALGVGRMTPGTTLLWQSLRPRKLTKEALARGGKHSRRTT